MAAIFISHSNRDNASIAPIKSWLAEEGYERVFLDFDKDTGLELGENWERRLYEEISRCHLVIVVVTPAWLASKWCFVEFAQARSLGKIIFPIVLESVGDARIAPELQGLDVEDWDEATKEKLRRRLKAVTDEVAHGFPWDNSRAPYPGILSFDRTDAAIYFGRDAEVRQICERLEARRVQGGGKLLLVIGASGSGKSSLVKAGVLPRIERERRHWIVLPPFRPERSPLAAFAKSLAEYRGDAEAWQGQKSRLASGDPLGVMHAIADDFRIGTSRDATLIITIDQFEEAFPNAGSAEQDRFLSLIAAASDAGQRLPILLLGTMRADVLSELLSASNLKISFESYSLRSMDSHYLPIVIEGPAKVASLIIEPGLSHRIVNDAKSADALPLIAFALRELCEAAGATRRLSLADYDRLGDPKLGLSPIENAIRRKADDVLIAVHARVEQIKALKVAFVLGLVAIGGEGRFVRRVAPLAELPAAAHPLLEALVEARLLIRRSEEDGTVVLEVAHEALLTAWPRLAGWLDEEREFLAGKAQLQTNLLEWSRLPEKEKAKGLLRGIGLERASRWLLTHRQALTGQEVAFIRASKDRRTRERLLVSGIVSVAVFAIIVIAGSAIANYLARRSALDCDLLAAEEINNVSVPGVEFDRLNPATSTPACERAVSLEPGNPRLMHNLGRSYEKAGNFADAVRMYEKAAALGFDWSMNNLGVLYLNGKGVPLNFRKGVELLRAAAEQKNPQAIANYRETDFSILFLNSPQRRAQLTDALAKKGLLPGIDPQLATNADLLAAVTKFALLHGLGTKGMSLEVIDRLELLDLFSRSTRETAH